MYLQQLYSVGNKVRCTEYIWFNMPSVELFINPHFTVHVQQQNIGGEKFFSLSSLLPCTSYLYEIRLKVTKFSRRLAATKEF